MDEFKYKISDFVICTLKPAEEFGLKNNEIYQVMKVEDPQGILSRILIKTDFPVSFFPTCWFRHAIPLEILQHRAKNEI